MTYDRQTRTVFTDGTNGGVSRDLGIHTIYALKAIATMPGAPAFAVNEWNIIKTWLGAGEELSKEDENKLGSAWQSYLARGIAPSIELQANFDEYAKWAKTEKWQTTKIPFELEDVFDRLLATEREIYDKRKYELHNVAMALRSSRKGKNGFKFSQLTKNQRIAVIAACAWVLLVIYRTGGSHELFGAYLGRWDSDDFWQNLLTPPLAILVAVKAWSWIKKAD